MKRRMVGRGVGQERERVLNEATMAALRVSGTLTEIPTVDQVVLSATVLTENQRKLLTEFWTMRADNYTEYKNMLEFEKLLVVLREKKGEEKTVKKEEDRGEGGKKKKKLVF